MRTKRVLGITLCSIMVLFSSVLVWRENPLVKQLMEKSTEYKLAYINNNKIF